MVSRSHRGGDRGWRIVLRQPSGPVLANKGVETLTLGCSVSLLTLLSVTLPREPVEPSSDMPTLSILPGPSEETKAQGEKLACWSVHDDRTQET